MNAASTTSEMLPSELTLPGLAETIRDQIPSPALLFDRAAIDHNLQRMLAWAGTPSRLRPHAKTHKTREIILLEKALGIHKHKCATLAEAEMLSECGAADVLIAYPMVGPNVNRLARLIRTYPKTRFAVLVDDHVNLDQLAACLHAQQLEVDAVLDLNVGHDRTGLPPGEAAIALYQRMVETPGIRPGGLQVYDGHNTPIPELERRRIQEQFLHDVEATLVAVRSKGWPLPRIVLGGTPTMALNAQRHWPEAELSPGTCVLHDHTYFQRYPELGFRPAAWLLTRVISRPRPNRVTLDLGSKAVSPDLPLADRCRVLGIEGRIVLHNEEHLVLETPEATHFSIGTSLWALPGHVCPTVALYRSALVFRGEALEGEWVIAARDRQWTN